MVIDFWLTKRNDLTFWHPIDIRCFCYHGSSLEQTHSGCKKRCPLLELATYGKVKIQSLYGSWEKWGFVKVAVRRAAHLWKCPLGELPVYKWPWKAKRTLTKNRLKGKNALILVNERSTKCLNGLTKRSNRWINYWNGLAIRLNRWINYSNGLPIRLTGWIKQYYLHINMHSGLGFLGFNIISTPKVSF